ncbi:MAG: hypothetical protein JXR13_15040 [Thalassovita sp.]
MKRLTDWRTRLTTYAQSASARAFRPGEHDCALFVAGAVEALTGKDLAADWRGTYRTLDEGRAALLASGFQDQVSLVASVFVEVPPLAAQVGDIAVVPTSQGPALGVVQGARIWVLMPSGLGTVPLTEAEKAFRV